MAGVPIVSYRDKMGARVGEYKLAYFRQHVLPIVALSDPFIYSAILVTLILYILPAP